ncbi:hypothetical protein M0802_009659 [Mischocyttarus mexicanus]|nr:hypothetical protein M0802_009659 [Mischocyttarus mexicanus]
MAHDTITGSFPRIQLWMFTTSLQILFLLIVVPQGCSAGACACGVVKEGEIFQIQERVKNTPKGKKGGKKSKG